MADQVSSYNEAHIKSLIVSARSQKVILDSDLAAIFGVETKRLNEAVKRNIDRFPDDFAFRLNLREVANLKSQYATSSSALGQSRSYSHGGRRTLPMAFTEHGAVMAENIKIPARKRIGFAVKEKSAAYKTKKIGKAL